MNTATATHAFKVGDKAIIKTQADDATDTVIHCYNAGLEVRVIELLDATFKGNRYEVMGTDATALAQTVYESDLQAAPFTGQFSKDTVQAAKVDSGTTTARLTAPHSAFLKARQKAWEDYVESRRRAGYTQPFEGIRSEGFKEGFTQGAAFAMPIVPTLCAGLARKTDPATSQEAALVAQAGKLTDLVLISLRDAGPGTAHEVAARIGHPLNAVSPRFVTLKRRGLIHVSGGQKVGRAHRSIYTYGGDPFIESII